MTDFGWKISVTNVVDFRIVFTTKHKIDNEEQNDNSAKRKTEELSRVMLIHVQTFEDSFFLMDAALGRNSTFRSIKPPPTRSSPS